MKDISEAWDYLDSHPMFKLEGVGVSFFGRALDVWVVRVDPETGSINLTDDSKNTKPEVWLECGSPLMEGGELMFTHDCELDCGGDTFEEAIFKLARMVKQRDSLVSSRSKVSVLLG